MKASFVPKVSVCMIAYNVEKYIAEAVEGVLKQQTDFPVQLVIGEDCSSDRTRMIVEEYAKKYPERVKLLISDINRGIAGNAARTLAECSGEYVAVCDGDDVWNNPAKLQTQVDFLDEHPDYGAVFTDVEVVDQHGRKIADAEHDKIRNRYHSGRSFFTLLIGNYINNSTAVFRKQMIADHRIDEDRRYYTHDYLMWLHIASKSKIHYWDDRSTLYRKHTGGVTRADDKLSFNRQKFQEHLFGMICFFDQHYPWDLSVEEKAVIFRKLLSILRRGNHTPEERRRILKLMTKYYPGLPVFLRAVGTITKKRFFKTPTKRLNK